MEENLQQSEVSIVSVETAPAKKPFPKNKLIAIISIAIVVLCIATAIIINANRPINRFGHALKAGEYDVAAAIYKQNNSDEKFLERSAKRVGAILSSALKEYADGSITYDDVDTLFNKTTLYSGVENRIEMKSQMNQIHASKQAYEQGSKYLERKAYLKALDSYSAVIEEDIENYSSAQKAITSTTEVLCTNAVKQATDYMNQNAAVEAYKALVSVGDYRNDAVTQMLTEVTEKAQEQIIGQAEELNDNGDYKGVYLLLSEQPNGLRTEQFKVIEKKALDELFVQADKETEAGNYDAAISLLTGNGGKGLTSDCDAKIKEIKHSKNENKLRMLKSKITVSYDKIGKEYSIKNKNVYTLSNTRNIIATATLDTNALYMLTVGVSNRDWIFTNKIIIDCDGVQYVHDVDFSNRVTKVVWGMTWEAVGIVDNPERKWFAELYDDLEPVINRMRKATTVIIRFSGSGGTKDVTIPSEHITQAITIWDVYQILKEDPSLINVLM